MKNLQKSALLCALALALGATGCTTPVTPRKPPPTDQTTAELAARCTQLIAFFDRFGASRSNNSDGRRNHTRIAAEIDCDRGFYAEGIATMDDLLRRKKFTPPPAGPDEPEDNN